MCMGLSHKYCHVSGLNLLIICSSQSILFNAEQRLHKFICRPTVILQNSYNCRLSRSQRCLVVPSSASSYIAILHTARSLFVFTKPSAFRLRCTAAMCERRTIRRAPFKLSWVPDRGTNSLVCSNCKSKTIEFLLMQGQLRWVLRMSLDRLYTSCNTVRRTVHWSTADR